MASVSRVVFVPDGQYAASMTIHFIGVFEGLNFVEHNVTAESWFNWLQYVCNAAFPKD